MVEDEDLPSGLGEATEWLSMDYDEEWFEMDVRLGFGDSLNPVDYRTRAQMETQARLNLAAVLDSQPEAR